MNELLQALSGHGFSIPNLLLNGHVIRLDRTGKKSAWFVGFEHKTKKGESYVVAVYGDWKTGEKYEYKTARDYTKTENAEILKRIADAQVKSEREREQLQEAAKCQAESLWSTGGENSGLDYLHRKSIPLLYGCRSVLGENGRILLVPMCDSSGQLWGVQQIHPEGKKYFLTGQRINGLFHVVGPELGVDVIYIAEGFATATSIHQATGKSVVVAFNAQNLVHVAKELKEKYTTAAFVICGDDDQFTERDGQPYNPGREFAERASKACTGKTIYPKFNSLESKPTDFNDLHILEGIEAVKTQILGTTAPERNYILSLGFSGDHFYYTTSQNNFIQCFSPQGHNKLNLLSIMDLSYWQSLYPSQNDDEVDWTTAADDLMDRCRKKGPFNLNNVRATGAWLGEKKELILNRGDALVVEGHKVGFHSIKSRHIYEPSDMTIPEPSSTFLPDDQCLYFLETLNMLKWAHPDYYKFLSGWLAIAPICGALDWRPHLWLSGPSGSGKSTIMQEVVYRILKKYALFFQGQTTEAGIRQSVGKKAVPIVFDEFETTNEKSGNRIESCIELYRQASSETNANVTKGSANGESISYSVRSAVLVSSINVNLITEADKNRFTIIELVKNTLSQHDSFSHFKQFQKRLNGFDDTWVHQFNSRVFGLWDVFKHNKDLLFNEIANQYTSRMAQQYSPLLAGYQILQSQKPIDKDLAKMLVLDTDLEFKQKEVEESDEVECLRYLMGKTIYVNGPINSEQSVFEMLDKSINSTFQSSEWVDAAKRNGFIVKDGYLHIMNNHSAINDLLKGTRWVGNYSRSLNRIQGADNNGNKPIWANGASHKVVRIPIDAIKQ